MKKEIFATCALAAAVLIVGCSDQREAKPAEAQPTAIQKTEQSRPKYRRSVPSAVTAEEFNKAGMRGAGSPQAERK